MTERIDKETTGEEISTRQDTKPKVQYDENGLMPGSVLNPTGKGGFGDNPENRSNGKWRKEDSISYQYNRMLAMSDDEFNKFKPETKAQKIAMLRIKRAERDDDDSLAETKEITDRTEGKAKQDIGIDLDDKALPLIRGFVIPTLPEGFIDDEIAKARAKNNGA